VTGGTGTLGGDIVRALSSSPDWRVVANYLHDGERAARLQRATGCTLVRADIGDEAQVEAMFAGLPSLFAIVHAAGVAQDALLLRQSCLAWNETLRVNADGAFLVARAALSKLEFGGRLVMLASRAGEHGNAGQAAYAASKAAVIALVKCAAREAGERSVTVNAICPGFVPSVLSQRLDEAHLASFKDQSVLHSLGTPQQVTATVEWLLSDAASAISGQVIHCDSRI